ncbi:hypothetical protein vseg_017783 [Gypsophila vaccaria]
MIEAFKQDKLLLGEKIVKQKEIFIRWSPPPFSWTVLNIDEAARSNLGSAGLGGIFRDANSKYIRAFTEKLGINTSMRAELMALARGLKIAKDSQVLVHLLQKKDQQLIHPHIMRLCQDLIGDNNWKIETVHV